MDNRTVTVPMLLDVMTTGMFNYFTIKLFHLHVVKFYFVITSVYDIKLLVCYNSFTVLIFARHNGGCPALSLSACKSIVILEIYSKLCFYTFTVCFSRSKPSLRCHSFSFRTLSGNFLLKFIYLGAAWSKMASYSRVSFAPGTGSVPLSIFCSVQ